MTTKSKSEIVCTLDMDGSYWWSLCDNCENLMLHRQMDTPLFDECYACDGEDFTMLSVEPLKFEKHPIKWTKKKNLPVLYKEFSVLYHGQPSPVVVDILGGVLTRLRVVTNYPPVPEVKYTSKDALQALEGKLPDDSELDRLTHFYPSYEKLHRVTLLHDMLAGKPHSEIVLRWLAALGKSKAAGVSKGGLAARVPAKIRRTAIRLIYLRLRIDEGFTQKKANELLFDQFGSPPDENSGKGGFGQNSISEATKSPTVNNEL